MNHLFAPFNPDLFAPSPRDAVLRFVSVGAAARTWLPVRFHRMRGNQRTIPRSRLITRPGVARALSFFLPAPMRKASFYSKSVRSPAPAPARGAPSPASVAPTPSPSTTRAVGPEVAGEKRGHRWVARFSRHERLLLIGIGALIAAVLIVLYGALAPRPRSFTQVDIDAAVRHSLETNPPPSRSAEAYAVVAPSVVRVEGYRKKHNPDGSASSEEVHRSTGSGVVVLENGAILTNLHVVAGAERIDLVFADGQQSEAVVISTQPENDLAVLRAKTLPDDLTPATLRSTADLRPGDEVTAVGFPFGIGPSVSAGVVSGLGREYQSPEGEKRLTNLIQFDAAANPGSSGGPLVTTDGEVVGIVTGILNPSDQRVFAGIGFAVPIENAASAVGLPPF
jgi:S1-C subfamily serine protease